MMDNKVHPSMIPFYKTDDVVLYLDKTGSEYFKDGVFLHLDINTWSVSKYKEYLKIWEIVKGKLAEMGYEYAYAAAPPDKREKLIRMFKLEDTGVIFNSYRIMRIKLWPQQYHS